MREPWGKPSAENIAAKGGMRETTMNDGAGFHTTVERKPCGIGAFEADNPVGTNTDDLRWDAS